MLHLEQLAEIDKFSRCFPVAEIGGRPMALYNPASGAWTDMIWAGGNLLGEVTGSQAPEYRLLDHEGSLVATTNSSGSVTGMDLLTPYGQAVSNSTSDFYLYTGLDQDAINGSDHAWYRNYSTAQSRWLRPDPYNGSYDLYNPQSFNRYNYVENNPLIFVDPSGEAMGVVNGAGGSPCSVFGGKVPNNSTYVGNQEGVYFNPCDPFSSLLSAGIYEAINGVWGAGTVVMGQITPFVGAAITIACSAGSNSAICGHSGLTSLIPGYGGDVGKGVGDGIALAGAYACTIGGGPTSPGCVAFAIYTVVNDLFSVFCDAFGGPQFTGSLVPRPADLSGLGTSKIGIPNKNLSIKDILGQPSQGTVLSPGMKLP
jgi:RHS repeat-associated protein